ncbi:queuosine biosynthesis protein QueC [Buchnera aphidicola (Aphis glycines)]|uniref:7-cyano-7-deazaguanine synthase n=1 Tax=Buchnera aphidicola (Aphis glycines) TaxID=1265350 RepID=A0A0M3RSL2_9GAMM|nr:7-cyano-7-deazaguanine synthase QueC [Buchnera aphidicola]ALD15406.1 queuosine biosynthesis protein QueC [Buchnera aphidicola (Aphis glycines)]
MNKNKKKILIVFSGGQDSTTCLIHYSHLYKEIYCITFDYDQIHKSEIDSSRFISKYFKVKKHIFIDIKFLKNLAKSSLTDKNISIFSSHQLNPLLPSTFVPGRNILFLTLSSIYAFNNQIDSVVLGVNTVDFSGYPDCRNEFIETMNRVIQIGMDYQINFKVPLMNLSKAEIWSLSHYWNLSEFIFNHTVTCYKGLVGNGCGQCKACCIRRDGFDKWKSNPAYYMKKLKKKFNFYD